MASSKGQGRGSLPSLTPLSHPRNPAHLGGEGPGWEWKGPQPRGKVRVGRAMGPGSNPCCGSRELDRPEPVTSPPSPSCGQGRPLEPGAERIRTGGCGVQSEGRGCLQPKTCPCGSPPEALSGAPGPLAWTTGPMFCPSQPPWPPLASWGAALLPPRELLPFCSPRPTTHFCGHRDFREEAVPHVHESSYHYFSAPLWRQQGKGSPPSLLSEVQRSADLDLCGGCTTTQSSGTRVSSIVLRGP